MIYLDNSATTKPCAEAIAAINQTLTENWANPSALYQFGIDAAKDMRLARAKVAAALGAEPDRVFFTSGGTEADNWALLGAAKRFGKKNKHIITTAIEHHAVLNTVKELEANGFEVTYLQPEKDGTVTLDTLRSALRKDTFLVHVIRKCFCRSRDHAALVIHGNTNRNFHCKSTVLSEKINVKVQIGGK